MHLLTRKMTLCFPLLLLLSLIACLTASAYHATEDSYEQTPANLYTAYQSTEDSSASGDINTLPDLPPPIQYEVSAGDTLYKIAKSFGVSVPDLIAFNALDDPGRLSVGQRLQIPPDLSGVTIGNAPGSVIRQVLQTTLTAYTAGIESTGKTTESPAYGITASGSKAAEGRTIAVDPDLIPIGSTVFIDGFGFRRAEDTGSAIRGARIDLFMNDVSEALNFGVKKNVKVYVLAEV